ncbi:MAG: ABC transporter substrate-binding protein [Steroidobacteraceae bacterium]
MNSLKVLALCAATALLAACATGPVVRTQTAEQVDLTSFHSYAFVAKPGTDNGKYKSLADLKGMTIALNTQGTTSQMYVDRILAMAKLTKDDVKYTIMPFTSMITALSYKAVDAAWEVEPFVSIAASK